MTESSAFKKSLSMKRKADKITILAYQNLPGRYTNMLFLRSTTYYYLCIIAECLYLNTSHESKDMYVNKSQ